VVTISGTIGTRCIANACGQGPVTAECSTSTSGCAMSATLNSGVTFTCNLCPQGGCA
jgi:hypothetical protein